MVYVWILNIQESAGQEKFFISAVYLLLDASSKLAKILAQSRNVRGSKNKGYNNSNDSELRPSHCDETM
jgi:hypothetical protein